ncbi:olfactory receptor 51G1-like [Chanos chanos]|uniref:Olfactory receptor 51G1-like n=1 Tax=Chanos chanos TaxID=29144 RepID=A0A6J2VLD5_CHACN|nr:olfactory receptor 51G1-like [Chanos chanos]
MFDSVIENASHTEFILNGFHSFGEWKSLLFIPFSLIFLLSFFANSLVIHIIISRRSLHSPMCILIGLLAVHDLFVPIVFVPRMLLSFLFDWNVISLQECLTQMFFVHFFGTFHSTILLWMALDRYYAICTPLHYNEHMAYPNILKFVLVPTVRNSVLILVMVTLASSLSFCHNNVMDHCFCEHMALVQLACGDISINNLFGLMAVLLIPTADFVFTTASYIVIFATVFKYGQNHLKAINTCITHIIVITCSLMFFLIASLSYRIKNNFTPSSRVFFSAMYLLIPSCFNPIIYAVRTKEIRQQLVQFLTLVKIKPLRY